MIGAADYIAAAATRNDWILAADYITAAVKIRKRLLTNVLSAVKFSLLTGCAGEIEAE